VHKFIVAIPERTTNKKSYITKGIKYLFITSSLARTRAGRTVIRGAVLSIPIPAFFTLLTVVPHCVVLTNTGTYNMAVLL